MWRLAEPWYLLLLALPLVLPIYHIWSSRRGRASILFSGGYYLKALPKSWRVRISPHLHWLRYPGLALLVVALSRPQVGHQIQDIQTFGVDIVLILDVSGTMATRDMRIGVTPLSRLDAAKIVMNEFIMGRDSDRIGLIAFGSHSLILSPVTVDYALVTMVLDEIKTNLFPQHLRMTAIGDALGVSTSLLQKSEAKTKVIILLTDGAHNAGEITPLRAAEIAKSEHIRIHAIGFGSPRVASVDEQTLKQLAGSTGGRFFRSGSLQDLKRVYEEIDKLEKSEVILKNYQRWEERFQWFLWSGCFLLLLEALFNQILCRRMP